MIENIVRTVISREMNLNESDVHTYSTLKDLNIDSLDIVEIVSALEDELNIQIDDSAIQTFTTVQDIVDYINKHMGFIDNENIGNEEYMQRIEQIEHLCKRIKEAPESERQGLTNTLKAEVAAIRMEVV